jgi:hypothetical protein
MNASTQRRSYYYHKYGKTYGPFDLADMQQKRNQSVIASNTAVSLDGVTWQQARDFPELEEGAQTPPVDNEKTETEPRWYFTLNGVQQKDPVSLSALKTYITNGTVKRDDQVCNEGSAQWHSLDTVADFAVLLPPPPSGTNRLAIAGFVTSLIGLLLPPIALIGAGLSVAALNGKNKSQRGFAVAGTVIGAIGSACCCIGSVLLVGTGEMMRRQNAARDQQLEQRQREMEDALERARELMQ